MEATKTLMRVCFDIEHHQMMRITKNKMIFEAEWWACILNVRSRFYFGNNNYLAMSNKKSTTTRRGERGNALFLILIAVALFAALSYAINQSGRGGGDVSRETVQTVAAQIVDTGAGLRQAATRMLIAGTSVYSIVFTSPSTGLTTQIFDAKGGGATNGKPPPAAGTTTAWSYRPAQDATTGTFVCGVGTAAPEVLVILGSTIFGEYLDLAVCVQIQKSLGFPPAAQSPPPLQSTQNVTLVPGTISNCTVGNASTIYNAAGYLTGQPFACFNNAGAGYGYYHVLVEN
jgi:hypothetical protein